MAGGGGTSAASPVWAGIVGLLNDARLRARLPVLGYLNPLLYSAGDEFLVDIQHGRTRGCNGRNEQNGKIVAGAAIIPGAGWNATVGWDPATGLGIPNFQKMLKVVLDVDEDGMVDAGQDSGIAEVESIAQQAELAAVGDQILGEEEEDG
jgi:tripeptidyl-peptidase-1